MRSSRLKLCSICSLAAIAAAWRLFGIRGCSGPGQPRNFAPGVVTTIPPDFEPEETVSTHDLVEIRANADAKWQPELMTDSRTLYGMSEGVKFRRDVSCLEFAFKPLRMIHVDVTGPDGKLERKLVWYMVYSVRNTGETLKPVEAAGRRLHDRSGQGRAGAIRPELCARVARPDGRRAADRQVVSRPRDSGGDDGDSGPRNARHNRCSIAPRWPSRFSNPATAARTTACGAWPRGPTSIRGSISSRSTSAGCRTPIAGRTRPAAYQAGEPPGTGRTFTRKTLQLNFWRPGDEHLQDEREIRFGVARGKGDLYDVSEGVAYVWVYR